VYQKAYIEAFVSPANLAALMEAAEGEPTISYMAADAHGNTYSSGGSASKGPQAVTWGVFPGKEVQQPTVVDPRAFMVWKEEAFSLWTTQWSPIYDDDSSSADLIHAMHDTYFLVNVVDHDFIG
jgi:methylenetetrahydrofolate reductase (NADPH)